MKNKPHKIDPVTYGERLAKFEKAKLSLPPMPPEKRIEAEKRLAERYNV